MTESHIELFAQSSSFRRISASYKLRSCGYGKGFEFTRIVFLWLRYFMGSSHMVDSKYMTGDLCPTLTLLKMVFGNIYQLQGFRFQTASL
jgi:hypothetical protein